jgi:hypothetical protein
MARNTPASVGGWRNPRVRIDEPESVNASSRLTPPSAKNIVVYPASMIVTQTTSRTSNATGAYTAITRSRVA